MQYALADFFYLVLFRHHIYEKHGGPKSVELKEIGPRFEMRLYQVSLISISSMFYRDFLPRS
jgi:rRNA maturation protein Rpf1